MGLTDADLHGILDDVTAASFRPTGPDDPA